MSTLEDIGKVVDKAIGIFFPNKELSRRFARLQLKRQYAAAKTSRLIGNWSPAGSNINELIGSSSVAVRNRVRQLIRDFPYFTRASNVLVDYTVGEGILFQSRVKRIDGKLNRDLNQKIEDAFNFWADEADASGKLHYYEMMRLAKRQDIENGEFILVKTFIKDSKRYLPLAYQIFEADWLTDSGAKPSNSKNKVDQGIEYDAVTGNVLAYHFSDPDSFGTTKRIPADQVIHGFEMLRPGQLRGISPFASAVLVAHDLNSYLTAEIDSAKLAAKYLAFIKTSDPYSRQIQSEDITEEGGSAIPKTESSRHTQTMENAILEYLKPGEDIQIAHHQRPGDSFAPFVRIVLCMVGIATGVPYELLSGDYSNINYSTSRTSRNDFSFQLRPIAVRHIRHFALKTYYDFMDTAFLTGKLNLPGYSTDPTVYLRSEWQPPGMESVDPLRETKARIDEIKSGLRSPQEVVRARGRDLEDVYKEIAQAKETAKELGLEFEDLSTALATNPSALM